MKIYIRGKGSVNLTQKDFIAKGGEGKIFKQGTRAFKIYEDPSKMIPEAKIIELHKIANPNISKPIDIIVDKRNKITGFTSQYIDNAEVLCKLFTNSFRNNNGIDNKISFEIINNLRDLFESVHEANCLIVDANELNFLVSSKDFKTIYGIDVNSYQTPSFPATAIMPSIRDWTNPNKFSRETDWFSFGILSCQLFVGTHPFKGKHQKYKKNDVESRCRDKISIFNSNVKVPKATRDFGLIPNKFMDWYLQIFEKGKRIGPPEDGGTSTAIKTKVIVIQSTHNFEIKIIESFDDNIISYNLVNGIQIVKTIKEISIGNSKHKITHDVECVLTPKKLNKILVKIENNELKLKTINNNIDISDFICKATEKTIIDNTLFIRNKGSFMEVSFNDIGDKIIPSVVSKCEISPLSSRVYQGVIHQDLLGVPYITLPIVKNGKKTSYIVQKIDELTGHRVLEGKYENHICAFLTHKDNKYWRFILKFNDTFSKYSCEIEEIDFHSLNFVVLDNGICAMIVDDGEVRIFYNKYGKDSTKIIKDPDIHTTMTLTKYGTNLRFFRENKLYDISMK